MSQNAPLAANPLAAVTARRILLDANILVSQVDTKSQLHAPTLKALARLLAGDDELFTVPQSLFEFWAVASRSNQLKNAGLGWTGEQCQIHLAHLESAFPLLRDTPAIYDQWKRLVIAYGAQSRATHDARMAAAMKVHDLTHILTFNGKDFARFVPDGLTVIDPQTV